MGRTRFADMNCGIGQALEAFGDWWTLLIVRDAFFGARRFGDFERSLGIGIDFLHASLLARGSAVRAGKGQAVTGCGCS